MKVLIAILDWLTAQIAVCRAYLITKFRKHPMSVRTPKELQSQLSVQRLVSIRKILKGLRNYLTMDLEITWKCKMLAKISNVIKVLETSIVKIWWSRNSDQASCWSITPRIAQGEIIEMSCQLLERKLLPWHKSEKQPCRTVNQRPILPRLTGKA